MYLGRRKLQDYFPEYEKFKTPEDAKHELTESPQVTRAKYYIKNEFEVKYSSISIWKINQTLKLLFLSKNVFSNASLQFYNNNNLLIKKLIFPYSKYSTVQ